MKTLLSPRVVEAERLDGGVILTFDDGKCAIYPVSLLFAFFPKAEQYKYEYSDS